MVGGESTDPRGRDEVDRGTVEDQAEIKVPRPLVQRPGVIQDDWRSCSHFGSLGQVRVRDLNGRRELHPLWIFLRAASGGRITQGVQGSYEGTVQVPPPAA